MTNAIKGKRYRNSKCCDDSGNDGDLNESFFDIPKDMFGGFDEARLHGVLLVVLSDLTLSLCSRV